MDKEKVIKGLECCTVPQGHCERCPYETEGFVADCTSELAKDALALLKEQEAKNVKESTNMYTGLPISHCSTCGTALDKYLYGRQHEGQINYCPYCGQALKWE